MFKHMSIRWRLTILSIVMLTFCCVGLTFVLNLSAFQYIDASATVPITEITQIAATPNMDDGIMMAVPLQDAVEAKRGFGLDSLFYMVLFILGGGALTYYFVKRSLDPLHALNTQVKNRTVTNLAQRIEIPDGNDEITEITQSFNDMSDKLHEAFMMQQRFSASAAHELRTPLAVLQTKIDVFKKKNSESMEDYKALIAIFEKQTHKLRELIKNLLELTTNCEVIEQGSVSIQEVFEEILCDLDGVAKNKHVTMSIQCDGSSIFGNIDLLYRAFYNLVENGINYNRVNGVVDIQVKQMDDRYVKISISDTGIGIHDEHKKHIFEPFYRVDKGNYEGNMGVGLGLSIVYNIIQKHQGTITVSDYMDKGTSFHIILPLIDEYTNKAKHHN